MAIAYVQSAYNGANTALSVATAYSANNTAGNFLVAAVHIYNNGGGPGTVTVTDTQGNTWVEAAGNYTYGGLGNESIWYVENCKAGANTVTVSCTTNGGSNYPKLAIGEYSGVATSSSYDTQNHGTGSSTSANSGNITTATAGELLIGFSSWVSGSGSTWTLPGGWTSRQNHNSDGLVADQIATSGTYSFNPTIDASVTCGAYIAAFKAASGIAYVQSTTNSASTALTVAKAYTSNVTAGNLLVCILHVYNNGGGPGTITVTDTLGNTWTHAPGGLSGYGGLGTDQIWYVASTLGGANTVTATCTTNGGSNYPGFTILEYSGITTSSPVEDHNQATANSSSSSSGNVTTANASELLLGYVTRVDASGSATPAAGWTTRETGDGQVSEKIVTPGTYSFSGTWPGAVTWGADVIAFKGASGGVVTGYSYAYIM
jgi:hypothetical protein